MNTLDETIKCLREIEAKAKDKGEGAWSARDTSASVMGIWADGSGFVLEMPPCRSSRFEDDPYRDLVQARRDLIVEARNNLVPLLDEVERLRALLGEMLEDPHGCVYCDYGKLRRKDCVHDIDCTWVRARAALGEVK